MSAFLTYSISGNTDGSGAAVLYTSGVIDPYGAVTGSGIIRSGGVVGVSIQDTGFPSTTDLSFTTETTMIPILTLTDVTTAPVRYTPVARAHTMSGTGGIIIPNTHYTFYTIIPLVNERVRLTVAQGGNTQLITALITVAIDPHAEPDS